MAVKFELKAPPLKRETADKGLKGDPIEYVVIDLPGGDVLNRPATDADRQKYKAEYRAFSAPAVVAKQLPVEPEPPVEKEPKKKRTYFGSK
jgi:hypothetical protein